MSDIITRLLLKTDDFDAKLTRSKAGVNSYQNDVSSMAKTAGAGIAKFAGALGLAIGAGEGLMKVIQGSQATNDAFDNNMNACKDSVDAFFIALSTGDFSVFENGLLSVFSKAKELSAALDDIADKRLSIDLVDLRKQGEMTALEAIIRDTSKTKQERSDALSKYQSLAKEVAANRLDIAKEELTGNTNVELNKIGVKNLSQDDVTLYLEKLNNKDLNQQFLKELKYVSDYSKKYNEAWASVEKYRSRNGADAKSFQMEADFNNKWESPDKWMKRAFPNSEFKDSKQLMDFGKLFQQNDNGRTALYEYTKRLYEAENQNAADVRKLTKLKNSANAAGGGGKKDETPLAGSLAYFDAEIAKKNKELVTATTAQARTAVQIAIDELEAKKINLKIELDKSVFKELHGEMKGGDIKTNGIPTSGHGISKNTIKDMKLPKFKSPISKKDVKLNEEYNDSLTAMGGLMGSLSGAFESNTGSVLQWGATLLSTIAQAIPAIIGMMGVKATDTTVTQANTAAEVGNAAAKTLSAHASIPFAGIAIGLAGVASIIAVMSSMPKFATGGIVGGSSFAGDNVLARVNSGEMILNASQQSNLFRLLNGQVGAQRPVLGNISNIRMQPGKQIVEVGGHVRIQGGDLILAINNKNSKMKGKR
ncbi:hypothetical protein [Bacteroides sp.]|uniref:hypothetical protein n=1 Tax=Bacteroides sp. TaxID=29523 RepID=UPI002FCB0C31